MIYGVNVWCTLNDKYKAYQTLKSLKVVDIFGYVNESEAKKYKYHPMVKQWCAHAL